MLKYPDIIMVGEIRYEETSSLAINAALTGHLVLATIHTNSAAGTVARLSDMGVEPFLLTSTLRVVVGQRLVRTLKDDRRDPYHLSVDERKKLGKHVDLDMVMDALEEEKLVKKDASWNAVPFYRVKEDHDEEAYKGRTGIHEVLTISPTIKDLIMADATADDIDAQAKKEGMLKMIDDGVYKAARGVTTIEEVLRVISE